MWSRGSQQVAELLRTFAYANALPVHLLRQVSVFMFLALFLVLCSVPFFDGFWMHFHFYFPMKIESILFVF